MRLGSNPSKFGVKRSNTRFIRIFLVQAAQYKKQSTVLTLKTIRFPSNWWYLKLKILCSVHQGTWEVHVVKFLDLKD